MAHITLSYYSKVLNLNVEVEAVLPECYRTGHPICGEKLPMLLLLHGMTDNQTSYSRMSSLERYAQQHQLIIVTPTTHLGVYTNQYAGLRYLDYIACEVPDVCSRYFPVSLERENMYVAGLSMGGYGALKIGLLYPDRFSKVAVLSAGCDRLALLPPCAEWIDSLEMLLAQKDQLSQADAAQLMQFFTTFGSKDHYVSSSENNLFLLAERCKGRKDMPSIWMCCGTDDFALEPNRRLHQKFLQMGIAHEYREDEGQHNWTYWDGHLPRMLSWIAQPLQC